MHTLVGVVMGLSVGMGALAQAALAQDAQDPIKPQAVEIPLEDGSRLSARLSIAASKQPAPAVLMIPGYVAGANPRDEEAFRSPGEDSGTLIERHLTGLGFAVLRVPIGGGPDGGDPSLSLDALADRELQCVAYLRSRGDIDAKRVGIIGQSVGGLVAVASAARSKDIAFLVTLATPMESIDQAFDDALGRVLTQGKCPASERAALQKLMNSVFADAVAGKSADELRPRMEEFFRTEYRWLPEPQRHLAGKDADEFVKNNMESHLKDATSPMFRSLIGYIPTQSFKEIRCSTLVLFAGKDFKVEPERSARIARSVPSEKIRVEVIPEVDHFFLTKDQNLSIEFCNTLDNWLDRAAK